MQRPFSILITLTLLLLLLAACQEAELPDASPSAASAVTSPTITPTHTAVPLTAVLQQDPALGGYPPRQPIEIRFNQPVDVTSVIIPLLLDPPVNGRFTWSSDRTTLTFTPQNSLRTGREYTLTLPEGLTAVSGQPLAAPTQWQIVTLTAPRLESRTPRTESLSDRRPAIQLTFNHAMDRESVLAALRVEPPVAFNAAWEENSLMLTPQQPLEPGKTYQFRLGETAVDRIGTPLQPATWIYRLPPLLHSTVTPSSSNPNNAITLRFNYKIDPASIAQALTIQDEAGTPLRGSLTCNEALTHCTFTPETWLMAGTRYLILLSAPVQEANGDPLPLFAPLTFTTPPPILAALPRGNAANPLDPISVRFDRPMDEAATAAALVITPETPGQISWQETTLIFTPDEGYFAPFTSYTVTIEPSARGAAGEAILREAYRFNFRTDAIPDVANFGYGPNVQVLDTNGRRAIQYAAFGHEGQSVTFELYQLTLNQFLDHSSTGFGNVDWESQMPSFDTEGTTLAHTWEETIGKSPVEYISVQEAFVPADVPPGLYVLNLVKGHLNDQLLLILTAHTIMVKQDEGQLLAWVTDFSGAPAANVEVGVYARNGRLLASGVSDAQGLFRAPLGSDAQPWIVMARSGSDISASGLSDAWRSYGSRGNWWGWWQPTPAAKRFAAYVYTDRPIYRPGQTVFFKAIVRQDDDALLSVLPEGTAVTARLRDARNNVVQTIALRSNSYGTVNGQFLVAEGAMLGDYAIEVIVDGEAHRHSFQVQDYRKPDYAVTVNTDKAVYVAGETINVSVEAAYFFGEPVANARTELTRFYLMDNYAYGWSESASSYIWYQDYQPAQTGTTDGNGRLTFTLRANAGLHEGSSLDWRSSVRESLWAIEATTDDGSRQTVSGVKMVRVYSAAEIVTLDTSGYLHAPGSSFPIEAIVNTIEGQPVNGRTITLTLRRWSESSYGYDTIMQTRALTTGANGKVRLPFTIDQPGFYQIRALTKDRLGNSVEFTTYVYAFSYLAQSWYGSSGSLLVSADRQSYAPGDTARLLVESSFSGPALLTVERGSTRRQELVQLTAPATMLEVAILPDDRPNIYVTVNAWEPQQGGIDENTYSSIPDSSLRIASVNLSVPVTDKTLLITITPDKEVYAPREEATFTVKVTNQAGVPVAAEVSLAMVDEAIFSLSNDRSGPIFNAFYFERGNQVRTYSALAPQRYLGGGMGGGGGGDGGLAANPRADFPDTAVWFPVLQTDFNGEATVTVTLPDSLTSWRLTAKGATADTQVGETVRNITVRQDVVVRPMLPRVLTAGDEVQLTALVHNYSNRTQTIAVELRVPQAQLTIHNSPSTSLTIPAGGVRAVGWPVTAVAAGTAPITITARLGDVVADAILLPLAIRPLAVPEVSTQIGQFRGELATTVDMPAGALPMSNVRIELARSIAGTLLEGLEYLTGFPYGCVEQTMSRALPNAVVGRAFNRLGVGNPTLQADLAAKINASVQRLYGFQHNDGGWGWWYDDASHDYQTAWVIYGLATMREAGYEVDQGVIDRGVDWLNRNLSGMDVRTRAYALYSMAVAGQPNAQETLALLAQVAELDTFSQAGLALALHALGERPSALQVLDVLAATAVTSNNGLVTWPGDYDGHYDRQMMASSTRSTALALSAFAQIRPGTELEAGMVRYLMSQRKQQGWGTTNETAYAIIGLTDHLLATSFSESATPTQYAVILNSQTIASGSLGRGEPAVRLEISASQLRPGSNSLRITQSGAGQLYYAINSRFYLEQAEIAAAGEVVVRRSYTPVDGTPLADLKPGQLVRVEVTVQMPLDGSYIMVEDHLPGGLEALNEQLNNTSHVATAYDWQEPTYYWQEYGYNYKEVHGDRVIFFITEFSRGTRTFSYMARVTHSGEFVALPAEVSAMYDLALWGRSASSVFVVGE